MENRRLWFLLLLVVLISIILAAIGIMSTSGSVLFVVLMTLVLIGIWQERVRYEKRYPF